MTMSRVPRVLWSLSAAAIAVLALGAAARAADWDEVQKLKAKYLASAAKNAIEQQKADEAAPVAIAFPDDVGKGGDLKLKVNGPKELAIDVAAAPKAYGRPAAELVRIKLPKPMDMVSRHSGLAVIIKTDAASSPEVRVGVRLLTADGKKAEILPILPALSAWGDQTHELYFDWAFLNYDEKKIEEAVAVLKAVDTIEITFASAQRAPQRGASAQARSAAFTLSDLRLVDYLKGSYDPSRRRLKFDEAAGKWVPSGQWDLTLQHRCQEVTGIVATCGGEAGAKSAIDSLDHAAKTQCWDGSFLDGRRGATTVASGEYTFGFTIYGLLCGYTALEKAKCPALDEKITIGPDTMTRREFYQRMFYRGAMARARIATPSGYQDDIIGGNTLIGGANRVLGYAIAMRMVAEVLTDAAKKKEVLDKYGPFMQEIADAQGKFSGGFPLLGEGDQYKGKGIHYDAGYTRTHMDWLIVGVRRTGDPLLVKMLQRYQGVFEAAMDAEGTGILPMISERHQGTTDVSLIMPDGTAQVGMKYNLPIIAQWGYNCGMPVRANWEKRPGNHFSYASHARGYGLGAHVSILADDLDTQPVPKDLGYLFPRQFPVWSSRMHAKDGNVVRTSRMTFQPDGAITTDFRVEVGEYPETIGVPVMIKSPKGAVTAEAVKLSGWPKLLPEGAEIQIAGDVSAKGKVGEAIPITLTKETRLVIIGPEVTLPPEAGGGKTPFAAELILTPQGKEALTLELTVLRGTVPYKYTVAPAQGPAGK